MRGLAGLLVLELIEQLHALHYVAGYVADQLYMRVYVYEYM